MPCQLPFDCLNEILECLEKYKGTLYSCLLVNRLWCRASVRILWRNIWNRNTDTYFDTSLQIFGTLIACLPNESKVLLHQEGFFISKRTPKPLFNYASFFKVLSIEELVIMLNRPIILRNNQNLILQEMLKMFLKQISSLKQLTDNSNIITITRYPEARDCLANLSKLCCSSDSELFHQLSQICHNIQSLKITIHGATSKGLNDLISSQNDLKYLSLKQASNHTDWKETLPSLMKNSNTLIKFKVICFDTLSISFTTKFINLQVLILYYGIPFELQYVTFPQLQILKCNYIFSKGERLTKFLEINGKNLKEFYTFESNNSLNLAIAKFCPNIKSLYTLFKKNEIETLKIIFKSCQQLKSIESLYGHIYLDITVMLRTVVNHSPETFHELILRIEHESPKLLPRDLESFFSSWKGLKQQKSISIVIIKNFTRYDSYKTKENMDIIEKYKKLGVITKFIWQQAVLANSGIPFM